MRRMGPPSRRCPGIFALVNGLAHEGRLSVEEYESWRANNEWFENAYADPGKIDPASSIARFIR